MSSAKRVNADNGDPQRAKMPRMDVPQSDNGGAHSAAMLDDVRVTRCHCSECSAVYI